MTDSAARALRTAVTRKDVARYAGVSAAVVSYVVNAGPKNVSPATEARVRDAISVLGYRPNAAARALKLGSSRLLGLIVPDTRNPFFTELAHAVEEEASARGYAVLMTNSDGTMGKERTHIRNLAARQVDGVLLASNMFDPDLAELQAANIPAVLLNASREALGFATVGTDLRAGARAAVEHLIGHGHTSIALAMGSNVAGEVDGRELGWLDALSAAGLPEGPIVRSLFTRDGGYAAGKRLLASAASPTAVFASSDMQAVGILRALNEAGVAVPGEMAMVSFDGSTDAAYCWPPLSTVRQPVREMAAAAVSALVGLHDSAAPAHVVIPSTLVLRRSCGCP
jgi:LacI family transcriptional regulator